MKIGIIGAGFTGLAASFRLSKAGHEVCVFESEDKPGGLAVGLNKEKWKWSLEKHYHHLFTNDNSILNLTHEVGQRILEIKPKSSIYYQGSVHRLDSPTSLLLFNKLSFWNRFRMGIILLYLKLTPTWKHLEKVTAKMFFTKWMGKDSWQILWEPLFKKKFGRYANRIPASWFWARIKKRTSSIVYPYGGFLKFANTLVKKTTQNGGKFLFKEKVVKISKIDERFTVTTDKDSYLFDKVICTLPNIFFEQIARGFNKKYVLGIKKIKNLGAVTLLLRLNQSFLKDGTYWLNINEMSFPFLVVIEHTNFIQKNKYGGDSLIYVGNYLENDHPFFSKSSKELVKIFMPYLRQINPDFSRKWILGMDIFKVPFAQPVIPLNYSKNIMPIETPVKGLYLANIEQVYPWDRGTNYAVELGEKVSDIITRSETDVSV